MHGMKKKTNNYESRLLLRVLRMCLKRTRLFIGSLFNVLDTEKLDWKKAKIKKKFQVRCAEL